MESSVVHSYALHLTLVAPFIQLSLYLHYTHYMSMAHEIDRHSNGESMPLLNTELLPAQSLRISERMLVFGYFFTTWNIRADAWAISLFLSLLFPNTLLPISIYAFSSSLSCLLFGPAVGWIVDKAANRVSCNSTPKASDLQFSLFITSEAEFHI